MIQVRFEGPEAMLPIVWDNSLAAAAEETRAALCLHSQADVVRLAMHAIPDLIFQSLSLGSIPNDPSELKTTPNDYDSADIVETPIVQLLDEYRAGTDSTSAITRISLNDIEKSKLAAGYCHVELADFAYRATRLFASMESSMPGFAVNIKGTHAQEDITARKFFGLTDIQPWGDEDYRDYSLPEDE